MLRLSSDAYLSSTISVQRLASLFYPLQDRLNQVISQNWITSFDKDYLWSTNFCTLIDEIRMEEKFVESKRITKYSSEDENFFETFLNEVKIPAQKKIEFRRHGTKYETQMEQRRLVKSQELQDFRKSANIDLPKIHFETLKISMFPE